jgi:hypothetical protein
MAIFAVMKENIVQNVIVANDIESAELASLSPCIEWNQSDNPQVGWIYNGTTFEQPTEEA